MNTDSLAGSSGARTDGRFPDGQTLRHVARGAWWTAVLVATTGLAAGACSFGAVEQLEMVSVEARSKATDLVVTVAHASCGVEPMVVVSEADRDVSVSAEMRGVTSCDAVRLETDLVVSLAEPLGDRSLVVYTVRGDASCSIDGDPSLRCSIFVGEPSGF